MGNVSRLSNICWFRKELPTANSTATFTEENLAENQSQAEVLCGCQGIAMQFLSSHENANDAV